MTTVDIKKVLKIGGSFAVILPKRWARQNVSVGQEMIVVGTDTLTIYPVRHGDSQITSAEVGRGTDSQGLDVQPAEPLKRADR